MLCKNQQTTFWNYFSLFSKKTAELLKLFFFWENKENIINVLFVDLQDWQWLIRILISNIFTVTTRYVYNTTLKHLIP